MSKFGLLEPEDPVRASPQQSISERLAEFSGSRKRHVIDIAQVDAAAAPHGFTSREPPISEPAIDISAKSRRRRAIPPEPTRHLALRLTSSQYDRFVAYADRYQLTYQDALVKMMDQLAE